MIKEKDAPFAAALPFVVFVEAIGLGLGLKAGPGENVCWEQERTGSRDRLAGFS